MDLNWRFLNRRSRVFLDSSTLSSVGAIGACYRSFCDYDRSFCVLAQLLHLQVLLERRDRVLVQRFSSSGVGSFSYSIASLV
ncbi:unnamed protein product [Arabis nemorensis]|uniref:Uncharacterized protein n=1 Tax=Arabis nemorensis TaxID=586526 RepID=A0A565BKM9_9BRAS|nr:unnamed protein product [Arabis nemorensis]